MKKRDKKHKSEEQAINPENVIEVDAGGSDFQMDSEAPKIQYKIGMSMENIQEIFDSIPISPRKQDLIINIKKLEDVYNFLLTTAKTVNENRYNEINEKESKRITDELERIQKEMETKNRQLEEEVANNIKMHNDLRDKHLAEIQKIYQESKDTLLNEAIMMVSKYLNIDLDSQPKTAKK